MPSPLCLVKEGAGAFQPTTTGVNVTPNASLTIGLASTDGVYSWSLTCVGTDELSVAASVNVGIFVDPVAKTAAVTAPGAVGRTWMFQSVVNGGRDVNGVLQPSYTTTFVISTAMPSGDSVLAANETTERGPFGWIKAVNALIRGLSVVTSKVVRYIGDAFSDQRDIQIDSIVTTDATATNLFTFATTAGRSYYISGFIEGTTTSLAGRWLYRIEQYYENASGTLTARITSPTGGVTELHETSSSITLVADVTGTTLRVRISTGLAATTIRWRGRLFIHEGLP